MGGTTPIVGDYYTTSELEAMINCIEKSQAHGNLVDMDEFDAMFDERRKVAVEDETAEMGVEP